MSKNLLVASKLGSGKSKMTSDLIIELVKQKNVNCLLSVHESKAALAYAKEFKKAGIECFVLSSHESIFGHQKNPPKEVSLADYDCPWYDEIQYEIKLGVISTSFKAEYCEGCPLLETCHYPNQYRQVMDEKYKVVIIQHAHFSATEVLYKILQKKFKTLFIDETFIKNIFACVEFNQREFDVLEANGFEWSQRLFKWLKGDEKAVGKLDPSREELESLQEAFKAFECPWRIPDLIRYYNQHRIVNSLSGIEIVYELPSVPIRVFLDATPPIDLIKQLTGIKNIEIYGEKEVIDITKIHPGNRRYQVLDITNSVSRMKDQEFFEALLDKACKIVRGRYKFKQVLFTVYGSDKVKTKEFIDANYPDLLTTIDIGLMSKGTNKWADFDAQFIFAGRYRLGKSYYEDMYKYKATANYYRLKNNEPLLINPYPIDLNENTRIGLIRVPVRITQRDEDGELKIVEYPGVMCSIPRPPKVNNEKDDYWWFRLIDQQDVNEMEQTERIRWTPDKPKEVFHMHGRLMRNIETTHPLFVEDYLTLTEDLLE